MGPSSRLATFVFSSAVLAACAPDAWKPDRGFDAWLAQLGTACEGKTIGNARVEDLVRGRTQVAIQFTDVTSRLYHGRITPDSWTAGVVASLNGWRNDSGVRCVLDRYAEYRETTPPAPRY